MENLLQLPQIQRNFSPQ